jgi:phosphatidylglycerol:prolipoprotein diacylglycerol transferase
MTPSALSFPNISPEIVSISLFGFEFALRWYALAYIVGIIIGFRFVIMAMRRPGLWPHDTPPMTREDLDDLLFWIVIGIIVGGRLGYVLFYKPAEYIANPVEIFYLWRGGMAFHGGLLGVVLAAFIFTWRRSIPQMTAADAIVLAVPPGLLLGRIANFINAELWGRPTDLPWGVIFPGQAAQACGQAAGALCARHPSQLYEAALEGLILGAVLLWMVWRQGALKKPGLLCGTFFAGYGLARFLVEFVRQPDAQFISPGNPLGLAVHIGGYGFTMGQILSLPMILLGFWLIRRARSRHAAIPA